MPKWLILIVGCVAALSRGGNAMGALPETASCTSAYMLAQTSNSAPGELTRQFVSCSEELFAVMTYLLRVEAQVDQKQALNAFIPVFVAAGAKTVTFLRDDIVPTLPTDTVVAFEAALRQGLLMDEITVLQQALRSPGQVTPLQIAQVNQTAGELVFCDADGNGAVDRNDVNALFTTRGQARPTKKSTAQKAIESVKEYLKVLWAAPKEEGQTEDQKREAKKKQGKGNALVDVLDEIMELFDGERPTTVNDARACVLLCKNVSCAP